MGKQLFALILALGLTIGPAILHGRFSNRWETPANLEVAGNQLHELPRQIGNWISETDLRPLGIAVCRELGLVEHVHRRYFHSTTGHRLDLLLMVGPPGRLVRHPPEVCYANRANQRVGPDEMLEIARIREPHAFRLLNFKRATQPMVSDFSVAYGFADQTGTWSTPSSPRMAFGAEPVLYKLQVLSDRKMSESKEDIDDFLSHLVGAFHTVTLGDVTLEELEENVAAEEQP